MHIEAILWEGSSIQLQCEHTPGETARMALVRRYLDKINLVDDLTDNEIELRDQLTAWLDARNAEYEA